MTEPTKTCMLCDLPNDLCLGHSITTSTGNRFMEDPKFTNEVTFEYSNSAEDKWD